MPLQHCQVHNQQANVICLQAEEISLICPECFFSSGQNLGVGVVLNEASRDGLVEWDKALSHKFGQILGHVRVKGSSSIFEMRLNKNYPKGLINQLSTSQTGEVTIKIIEEYLQNLLTNVDFIVGQPSIEDLNIQELLKDIYVFFVYDTSKGLNFLGERVKAELLHRYPNKSIYEYVDFTLVSKELRSLEMQRKSLTGKIKQSTLLTQRPGEVFSPLPLREKRGSSEKDINKPYSRQNSQRAPQPKNQSQSPQRVTSTANQDIDCVSPTQGRKQRKFISPPLNSPQLQAELARKAESQQDTTKQVEPEVKVRSRLLQRTHPQATNAETSKLQHQLSPPTKQTQEEMQQLRKQISHLRGQLQDRNRSIKQLNSLISNEEQQLAYRQNQVEVLTEDIKKLLQCKRENQVLRKELQAAKSELNLKERSITELNKLIGNEEEELQFRESEVETLTREITKLVKWKERCEEIEARLNEKERQLDLREKGIKELNNVISNEEQELAFRESEVEMLTNQIRKAQQRNTELEIHLDEALAQLKAIKKQGLQSSAGQNLSQQNFDQQLMEQVIELESSLVARDRDIKKLVGIVNSFSKLIPADQQSAIAGQLRTLTTITLK